MRNGRNSGSTTSHLARSTIAWAEQIPSKSATAELPQIRHAFCPKIMSPDSNRSFSGFHRSDFTPASDEASPASGMLKTNMAICSRLSPGCRRRALAIKRCSIESDAIAHRLVVVATSGIARLLGRRSHRARPPVASSLHSPEWSARLHRIRPIIASTSLFAVARERA